MTTSHGPGLAMISTALPVDTHLAHVTGALGPLTLTLEHAENVRAGHEETSLASPGHALLPVKAHLCGWRPCLTSPKHNETPCVTSPFAVYLPESTHFQSLDTFTLQ